MEQGLNLKQQLQATPKWKEFEEWYNQYLTTLPTCTVGDKVHLDDINKDNLNDVFGGCVYAVNFCFLPFEFQKGVFEKFIESRGYNIEKQLHDISYQERSDMSEQELLKLRYKEAWFIRTVVIISDSYTPTCINPVDNYLNRVISFDSFEELLIWYFNN